MFPAVSLSCLSDNRRMAQCERCGVSRATGASDCMPTPSRMEQELAIRLQEDGIHYQTQVEIPVTTADFDFPLESRPLLVFVDGPVHFATAQITKDEEVRSVLRRRGYMILEL